MKNNSIATFLLLIFLVIISQYFLLKPIIGQGFTHEDYAGFYSIGILKNQFFSD